MNKIYVFSATGTGLSIAKKIGTALSAEIVSIPKLMAKGKWSIEGDVVGFIYPCYYGGMPQLVKQFVDGADKVKTSYNFAVVSAGGNTGYSVKELSQALEQKGAKLQLGHEIMVASNYMNGWYYNLIMPNKEALKNRLLNAEKKVHNIVRQINKREVEICKQSFLGNYMPKVLSPSRYVNDTRPWDSEFAISSACNKCGICEKVCPVENISVEPNGHKFEHNCQRCMACIQFCPKSAFSIDGKPMDKEKYVYPGTKLQEMIIFNRDL